MSFSTALTTLVGVLGLANLVLVLGRTHRVAERSPGLDDLGGPAPAGADTAGAAVAAVTAVTTATAVTPVTAAPDPRS